MYDVLIVDDEPMIRKGLTKILETSGTELADIRTAENGLEALALIRERQPDFLFTDIRMAKMDGLELCGVVARDYPFVQIVIVTGYDDFEYARQGIAYGVKDYILKPITKKSIHQIVRRLVDAERQRETAQPSLSRSNEWVAATEEAIWTLQENGAAHAVETLLEELREKGLSVQRQAGIAGELCELLVRRLNERDVYALELPFRTDGIRTTEELRARLMDFASAAMETLRAKRRGRAKDPIEEAKKYIEEHLSRDFSLEEVADLLGLNASYFSQLFKQMTGETFASYRIRRRMELAKQLLAVPHRKITDISYEVGYADHPHFTKTFKKVTGDTPKQYREKLGIDR
ncbi:response regulator [Paenibacillus sp.]|uniref:response regulator n=1 Tax=Paenibacillus sp. TaxID=58172 RepID=UPI002D6792BF|nr:response regulator [Paenibacillus sp.]HZG57400.1 response regulator [Paenibacillus sp.]